MLDDPERLNAMGEAMARDFAALVDDLRGKSLRVLILTGAGRAFSAGGDLEMLEAKKGLSVGENRAQMMSFYEAFLGLRQLDVPLLAAVNGYAVGAGMCLACACDLRMASATARMGFPFTGLGLAPGMGATWFLPRLVGHPGAADLLLTGRLIGADEARAMGLVGSVVAPEALAAEAEALALRIASNGPDAIRHVLQALRDPAPSLQQALQREAMAQALSYSGAEFAEGLLAAREKRSPRFL